MMYGKIECGCCALYPRQAEGLKPVIETTPEAREGYYATFIFEDAGDAIVKQWQYHKIEPPEKDIDATAEDLTVALAELGVTV